jgi:hypothetical protein
VAQFPGWLVPPCLLVASEVTNEAPMTRIRGNRPSLIVLRQSPTGGARPVRSCGLSVVRCNDSRAPRRAGGGDCNFCLSPSGEGKDSDDTAPQSVDEGRATHHPFARGEPEQQAPYVIVFARTTSSARPAGPTVQWPQERAWWGIGLAD